MRPPAHARHPARLFRSATVGAIAAMGLFETMHRVLHLDESISGVVLGIALIPAIATGLVRQVATLLADPDGNAPTIVFAFANIVVTILFFAVIYLELGIYSPADPTRTEITNFFTCLYFSASTITTAGLGDFVPTPEARFLAAVEMLFGYVAFGIVTAATFFLLVHRSRAATPAEPLVPAKRRRRPALTGSRRG